MNQAVDLTVYPSALRFPRGKLAHTVSMPLHPPLRWEMGYHSDLNPSRLDLTLFDMEQQQRSQTMPKVRKTEREQLRTLRTQKFLDELARDGNRLVALSSGTSDSGAAVREAEVRMELNIESMIKSLG